VRGLKQRAGDAGPRERTRAGLVARALFRLRDPELLAPVAATMLASTEASDSARSVLVLLGAAGAQAMVRARRSRELNDEARASFIAVLRDRGAEAFAAIAAGLEDADREGDDAWAEDLLRALPDSEHEPLACAASRYVAHASPALRRAAIHALGGLGGAQAIPKLRAALGDEEASVRRAACAALRRIKGLDVETAVELTKIACGDVESALELRVMAAAALAQCADGARVVCIEALRRIVDPPARSLRDLLGRPNGENELVVATACRTLLAIGGDEGRRAVERRSAASGGELKRKLRAMLSSGSSYS